MMKQQTVTAAVLLGALALGFFACVFHQDNSWSLSERRRLAQKPAVSVEALASGAYMKSFETYSLDQFPLREVFRGVKAGVHYHLLHQRDNNGIYLVDGSLSKLETELNEESVAAAARKIKTLKETYFPDSRVFYGVVPDKNYYLAPKGGYPHLDYERLSAVLEEALPELTRIDLYDCLSAEDYYKTDSHWRQECLDRVVARLGTELGFSPIPLEDYTRETMEHFRGVYWGQSALLLKGEPLTYLTGGILEGCTVHHFEDNTDTGIYEVEKLKNPDPYDVFLGGADPLLVIENPNAETDRELILFRDSFGSSLAPLLAGSYRTVTLVDLRYVSSQLLPQLIDFHGQDVLFLYSPGVYNNAAMLK